MSAIKGMTVGELIAELRRMEPRREVCLVLASDQTEPLTRENLQTAELMLRFVPFMGEMKAPAEMGGEQGEARHDRCRHADECMHFYAAR